MEFLYRLSEPVLHTEWQPSFGLPTLRSYCCIRTCRDKK